MLSALSSYCGEAKHLCVRASLLTGLALLGVGCLLMAVAGILFLNDDDNPRGKVKDTQLFDIGTMLCIIGGLLVGMVLFGCGGVAAAHSSNGSGDASGGDSGGD